MLKSRQKSILLAIIFMMSILAGNIFPANTLIKAEDAEGRIYYNAETNEEKLLLRLCGYDLKKISSFTYTLNYDTDLLRYTGYETHSILNNSLVSVNDIEGEVNVAIANTVGISLNWDNMITLEFEMLFEGYKDLQFENNVIECTDNNMIPISIMYDSKFGVWVENSKNTLYDIYLDGYYGAEIKKETVISLGLNKNAGVHSGSFTLKYDKNEMDFKTIKVNDSVKGEVAISYNETTEGEVQIAFACKDEYVNLGKLFDIVFIPLKPDWWSYAYTENFKITTHDLSEIEFSDSRSGYIYTNSEEGNNYFKIEAPTYVDAFETVDVNVELISNSGFSAMTMEFVYDPELFEFEECTFDNGIFSNVLTSSSGEKAGIVKIAAISAQNITESGRFVTIKLKSVTNVNKVTDFEIKMEEFVDAASKEVEYTLGSHQLRVNGVCIHEYGKPVFCWNNDNTQCVAVFTCINDAEHRMEQTCTIEKSTISAECEKEGSIYYTATTMYENVAYSEQKTESIEALEHVSDNHPVKKQESTCIEQGYTICSCINCGKELESTKELLELSAHAWDEGKVTKESTCTETGEKTYYCKTEGCEATKMEGVDLLEHVSDNHPVKKQESTCIEQGYTICSCINCGKELESTKELLELSAHAWDEGKITKESTCTETGKKTYYCKTEGCEATKMEEVGLLEHVSDNHPVEKQESTCIEQGYRICSCINCGKELESTKELFELADHQYSTEYTVDKRATMSANGSKSKHCTVCGDQISKTVIQKISTVTLSKETFIYDGKIKKPTVTVKNSKNVKLKANTDYTVKYAAGRKNVGRYAVTITFKGNYKGIVTKYFKINPKGTKVSNVTAAKKAFTVKWNKQSAKMATSRITGYQIQYSTSSKFTGAKTKKVSGYGNTSQKITGLKAKKTYYVRIRTYKTVSGKTYYSAWSVYKKVKTK